MKHIVIMQGHRTDANRYVQQYLTNEKDEVYFIDTNIVSIDTIPQIISEQTEQDQENYQIHVISNSHYVTATDGEFPQLKDFLIQWSLSHPNSCYVGRIKEHYQKELENSTDRKIFPEENRRVIKQPTHTFLPWCASFFSKPTKIKPPIEILESNEIFFKASDNNSFLRKLNLHLNSKHFTREKILDFFNEIKKPSRGRYDFIHNCSSISKFLVFFKARRNADEVNFWHTETYQTAVKLLKDAYIQRAHDVTAINRKAEEDIFLDYFRGNAPIHAKETSSRKNFK
ncbi:hypothetical protein [Legionella bozemanae]|uniref:Uncharacterized protein n=1 Tax=Legionella bozemanae TaxID=447 RepID=A0A0W0RRF6_LEGBO|nr:hypothetical protein [Legionella bozemanae]KTC73652.1 hypothetical protein Lboz_2298 [Legionella bozemanae]STO33479.1 Uncharacterised protein [Legionella bozemanae]